MALPVKLYRMMKAAADGLPEVGDTFGTLGVRPARPGVKGDVKAASPTDLVGPGDGGMSAAADLPSNLPPHMRPPKARYPIWEIDTVDLGEELIASSAEPPHYVIEPARAMTMDELQILLAATRSRWVKV